MLPLLFLPDEVLNLLVASLDAPDVVALAGTCVRMKRICCEEDLWASLHRARWRYAEFQDTAQRRRGGAICNVNTPPMGWRADFVRRHGIDRRVRSLLKMLTTSSTRELAWREVQALGMEAYDATIAAIRTPVPEPDLGEAWKVLRVLNQAAVRREWVELHQRAEEIESSPGSSFDEIGVEEGPLLLLRWYLEAEQLLVPEIAAPAVCTQLDDLAKRLSQRLPPRFRPSEAVVQLSSVLFEEEGFRGNLDDYYDTRNSLLDHVLASKKGIPISLSVLFAAVCARVGVHLDMIGMPGHFLLALKPSDAESRIFVDPFHGGRLLSLEHCERIVASYGISWDENLVSPVPFSHVWMRMVRNILKCCEYVNDRAQARSIRQLVSAGGGSQHHHHQQRANQHQHGRAQAEPTFGPLLYPSDLEMQESVLESPLLQQMLQSLLRMQQTQP